MRKATATIWTMGEVRARCDEVGDCLIWLGAVNSAGYPSASVDGKTVMIRRHIYTALMGRVLTLGRRVTTRCRNALCCSDKCLIQRHQSEILHDANAQRLRDDPMHLRRQQRAAVATGLGKLSAEIAAQVIASSQDSIALAAKWNVHPESIRSIRRGKTWRRPAVAANSIFSLGESL